MDLGLAGKKALILASSRGLGLGIATALAGEGASVILCGRSADRLEAAATALTKKGPGTATFCVADLAAGAGAAETIAARVEQAAGSLDILVHNMGGPPPGGAATVTTDQWRSQMDTMLLPVFALTTKFLAPMRAQKWGRILTVASSGVVQPIPNLAISNALRSALVGWNKTLAGEVAADGITANVIVPGRIETDRTKELDALAAKRENKSIEEIVRASRATIPVGRYGSVEEFSAAAAFLCGKPASYITGAVIRVDGGLIRSI